MADKDKPKRRKRIMANRIGCPLSGDRVARTFRACGSRDSTINRVTAEVRTPADDAAVVGGSETEATLTTGGWTIGFTYLPVTPGVEPNRMKVRFFENTSILTSLQTIRIFIFDDGSGK